MSENHPSISAVASHLDEQTQIATLAKQYYQEAGRPAGRSLEFWLRAEKELKAAHAPSDEASAPAPTPSEADRRVEEAMHLAQ